MITHQIRNGLALVPDVSMAATLLTSASLSKRYHSSLLITIYLILTYLFRYFIEEQAGCEKVNTDACH